ncbi:MFS transporter [Pullulanibacillus sp. KACC 23026]|uniref:MFS transporter n=1 Tax=Pullulanibacillus sp. KACC 23026 TaxID=3028315 RepID=UPI0023AFB0DB|nr:MFS transporter [Pullulanibacillus sp. KACC 23026]WEG13176.1 MFS transporter [Pullulanibacillus sp. KACC 23026]
MQHERAAKQNLIIMWFANFFIGGSMTMVIPFLSLYIQTLGHHTPEYVQRWSGWVFAITFVMAFIASPIWGRFGDRHGRKKILVIAAFGLAVSVFLMGFVTSVFQLFLLRFLMGIFTGFISMSQALISTQTPRHLAGRVLGTLQTGNVAGTLLGPMLAGLLADSVGFKMTFHFTAITLLIAAFFVLFGVKEFRLEEKTGKQKNYSTKEVLAHIITNPMLTMIMVVALFVQIANFSIQPILALYVSHLHGPENLAFFSGLAFSAAGLGNLLFARNWGKLGDKIGYQKILVILILLSGIVYLPGAFVTSIWQLVIIRFFLGITIGGVLPVLVAFIRQVTPLAMQGEVMGYNTSVRFLGNIIGPSLGGFISSLYGISNVFFVTSALLVLSGIALLVAIFKEKHNHPLSDRHAKNA